MTIRIERGNPTAEEVAALIGVLSSLPSSTSERRRKPGLWWRSGLPTAHPGWRESALFRPS